MYTLKPRYSSLWLILVASMTLSGCATKKYVRYQTGLVDTKVSAVDTKVDNLTNVVTETNERVDQVSKRADAAAAAAGAADQKAMGANQAAAAADRKAESANHAAQMADNRIGAVESRLESLDKFTAGEPQTILFKVNSDKLDDKSKEALDTVANSVTGQQGGYLIELQGFTDSTGSERYNTNLSQRRAESAQRYLVSKGTPLYRISIIGLGEERPVANNAAKEGREQNRRVEVRVLRSAAARATTNQN